MAAGVDLEVEVAADGAGVAGFADGADPLARPDTVAPPSSGWPGEMGVEVAALLALAVDQRVVAVENRVVPGAQHSPGRDGDQWRAAGGDDVEALMGAAAAARGAELADEAARPVRSLNRKDVRIERGSAVGSASRCSRRRDDQRSEKDGGEKERALQWCSITRSTMLYSFASSALMK